MSSLPTGTVTFLFTDVEGSTRLWEQHPDAMRPALARHNELLRRAVEDNGGWVVKTTGDGLHAAFATAPEALAAVLSAQRVLLAEPWEAQAALSVRMGLHTGVAEQRDADYYGGALNRAARLMAAGHGGQVLLSAATQELVRDHLPDGAGLRDLGAHRLKDLGRAEQVFQLLCPPLPADFPPLRTLDNPALLNNLPQQVSSFVGREIQVAEVKALLGRTRLLTLTGAGGAGKTRLSLQVAADLLDGEGDGVWLVELAPVTDPALVAQTVADVLGVPEQAGQPVQQTLVEWLRPKRLLLILDNCEHLVGACAALAADLLRSCPRVHILASSREALNVSGEQTYRVPSLSLPDPRQAQTVESLSQFEAVRLFIDRAVQTRPDFAVTNGNAPALASICHRLDGIPLAIELAAARARSLSVEDINGRLDQRFRLLTGGARTALPRQQTLRSLIDWSYDLLPPAEKSLLCRLSVFAGGWTLEAAEAVCVGEGVEDWEVLDLLSSLCDKSLVMAEPSGASTRYRMLETVRQYSRDRLLESGGGDALQDKHLAFYLALGEEIEGEKVPWQMKAYHTRLAQDLDNVRAALDWSSDSPERAESGIRLVTSLTQFWQVRGHLKERQERLSRAMKFSAGVNPSVRAKGIHYLGLFASDASDFTTARPLLEESLRIRQALGEHINVGRTLNALGNLALGEQNYGLAQQFHEQCLAIYRELGHEKGILGGLVSLGFIAFEQGDLVAARSFWGEGLHAARALGTPIYVCVTLTNLGEIAFNAGDYGEARTLWSEALTVIVDNDLRTHVETILMSIGGLLAVTDAPANAARLWGQSEQRREEIGQPLSSLNRNWLAEQISVARAALNDDPAFDAAWGEGRAMTQDEALTLAQKATEELGR